LAFFTSTANDDDIDGTSGDDEFEMDGRDDIAHGINGTDNPYDNAAFDARDRAAR
jgi:hypothetical protein